MIYIKSKPYNCVKDIGKLLNKVKMCIGVNTDKINDEVDRLLSVDTSGKGADYRERLYDCINYLEGITDFMDRLHSKNGKREFKVSYNIIGNYIECSPLNILNVDEFEIKLEDIIKIKDGYSLVSADYTNVLAAIGFDYVKNDLGYSWRDIEDSLSKSTNMVCNNEASALLSIVDAEDMDYKLMREMKIGSCDYMDSRRERIYGYYSEDIGNTDDMYKNIMEINGRNTMHIVLKDILEKFDKRADIGLISVEETRVNLMCANKDIESISEFLKDGICVQLFGRSFHFEPVIKVVNG